MDKSAKSSERLLEVNEALLLGSLQQHELREVAETLNRKLIEEMAERRRVEASLRRSETLYRGLFESIDEGFCIIEKIGAGAFIDFRHVEANPASETNAGFGKVLGKTIRQVMPDDAQTWIDIYDRVLASGKAIRFQHRLLREDRLLDLYAMRIDDGTARHVGVIFRDITERKRAEQAVASLAVIVQSSDDAIIGKDVDGVITSWNAGAQALFGYTAQEAVGQPMTLLFPADRLHEEVEILEHIRRGQVVKHFDTLRLHKDGALLEVALTVSPTRGSDGRIIGASDVAHDISARKRAEQDLIAAKAEAERANNAKSIFISRMSHELRTPLGAILGFAQLLQESTPPLSPTPRCNVERILQSGWFLLELIDELLDLTRIESGQLRLSMEPVALASVLDECRDMTSSLAQAFAVEVDLPSPDGADVVQADRVRLTQVLINLLSNAIKYNRAGGAAHVRSTKPAPGRLRIAIEDDGAGMSADQLAQLFQPFNRLGQETSTVQGTGIGLVVCKRLIEAMGGVIGVESTPGKGSVFWIEMNRLPPQEASTPGDAVRAISPSATQRPIGGPA